ncbi:MAG: hypothetical protein ACI4KF_13150 [Huintestinicola sp.]
MDIKEKIKEVTEKVVNDKNFASEFQQDPVKAVEKVLGTDLPDDAINAVIDAVKAKLSTGEIKDKIGGMLGGLFNK